MNSNTFATSITENQVARVLRYDANGQVIEPLDFSAWDALDTQERAAIHAEVTKAPFTGWEAKSTERVKSVLEEIGGK